MHLVALVAAAAVALLPQRALATYVDEMGLDEALRVHIGVPFTASAGSDGETVLLATRASALAALDAHTGALLWRSVLPQEQTLAEASFSAQGIATLARGSGGLVVASAWAPHDGAPRWSHALPLPPNGTGAPAAAIAALSASVVAPAVAAVVGGRLFLFQGAGGAGGEVRGLGAVAHAAFDGEGGLLALEAGPKGKIRVHASAAGALEALEARAVPLGGEGARVQRGAASLALLPGGQGGAVVAAIAKEGDAVLLAWVGPAGSSSSGSSVITLPLTGLGGRGTIVSLARVPASGASPEAAARLHSHVLALELSSGGRVYLGIDAASPSALAAPGGAASALTLDPTQAPRTTAAALAVAGAQVFLVHSFSALPPAPGAPAGAPATGLTFSTHAIAGGGGKPGAEAQAAALPAGAWAPSTRGSPLLLCPLPPLRASAGTPSGLALLLVGEDGWTGVARGGSVAWGGEQSGAHVAGALWVDVPARLREGGKGSASASASSAGTASARLALGARLASQAGALTGGVAAAARGLAAGARELVADPAGALLRFVGVRKRGVTVGALSSETPSSSAARGSARALVTLARSDAGRGAGAQGVRGVLSISGVAGGRVARRWRVPLPLGRAARAATAGAAPLLPSHYTAALLPSRPASNSVAGSEVLLIESTPSAEGMGYAVEVSWVSAESGEATQVATYTADAPPAGDGSAWAALPFVLASDGRLAYAGLTGGSSSGANATVFLPGEGLPVLQALGAAYVSVKPLAGGRGLQGFGLARSGSGSKGSAGAPAPGSSGSVASGAMEPLWTAALAPCAGAPGADALLAVAHFPTPPAALHTSSALLAGGGVSPPQPPRAKILPGDDSLLLKYQNPNLVAVVVGTPGASAGAYEAAAAGSGSGAGAGAGGAECASLSGSGSGSSVTLLLLDAVTGRVLHSRRHGDASGPVSLALHDNWVVYSYWSTASGRSELGVASLFEHTAVNTYDVTPWARTTPATAGVLSPAPLTSYGLPAPYVVHKVYVPPQSVRGLHFLASRHDVTPPALLLATASGGLLAMELRWLDPRRPLAPSEPGKPAPTPGPEGLLPYSPHLPLHHSWFLSHGAPLHRLHTVLTSHTEWESTSLVAALGLDHFFARVAPAKRYDQLDPEFNRGLLVGSITLAFVGTYALSVFAAQKTLAEQWK